MLSFVFLFLQCIYGCACCSCAVLRSVSRLEKAAAILSPCDDHAYIVTPCKFSSRTSISNPPSIPNLNPLTTPLVIAAQHRPASSIGLGQG